MLESLQHLRMNSAGFAIYGGLNLPENSINYNIELKNKPMLLDQLKATFNSISPIYNEELIHSVDDYDVYRCEIHLETFITKPIQLQISIK